VSGIVRAELTKALRRPMTWIALAIVLAMFVTVQVLLVLLAFIPTSRERSGAEAGPSQVFVELTVLPGGLASGLNFLPGLGVFALAVLAASVAGSEFTWGTAVPLFARGAHRHLVVIAKLLSLVVVMAVWMAATLAVAGLVSTIASLIHLGRIPLEWLNGSVALELPLGFLRSLLAMLPYVAATMALALLFRSSAVAMAIVLGYLVAERVGLTALIALRAAVSGPLEPILWLTDTVAIGANADRLTNLNTLALSPLAQETAIDAPYRAALILVAYSMLFATIGILALRGRDIALRPV
jgi:ABC-type transport system involved in multi-copper enzyme maturation permease subunit